MVTRLQFPRMRSDPRAAFWLAFFGRPSGPIGWLGARLMPFVSGRLNEMMAAELRLRADDDVLDVGCGSGGFLQHIAARVRFLGGVDASEIQVEMARRRLHEQIDAGTAEIALGDAEALPWADARFSAVASLNCLKFVAEPDRALEEMCRVLRAGGRVAILIDTDAPAAKSGAIDAYGQRQWSADDAKQMMEKGGFVDVSLTGLPKTYYGLELITAVKPA